MKFAAKIKDIGRTLGGSLTVTLESHGTDAADVMKLQKEELLDVDVRKHKKKRSLDANAYYWVLLTKLAKILRLSNAELHNNLLSKYGFLEYIEDKTMKTVLPDTDAAYKKVMDSHVYHLKPTSDVRCGNDGKMCRTYLMLRGSSTYNTEEMSRLIDGLISECKDIGMSDCEIASPEEQRILKERYGVNF